MENANGFIIMWVWIQQHDATDAKSYIYKIVLNYLLSVGRLFTNLTSVKTTYFIIKNVSFFKMEWWQRGDEFCIISIYFLEDKVQRYDIGSSMYFIPYIVKSCMALQNRIALSVLSELVIYRKTVGGFVWIRRSLK